jgi:hypothetical protein
MVRGAAIIVASGLCAFNRERIRHRDVAASALGLPPDGRGGASTSVLKALLPGGVLAIRGL